MKIAGIVTEYNPFHNGHQYQLNVVREECDAIVVIMSGSFVQRGDIAICDKWTRAKMAIACGADLVIELPVCFSLNTAERFAFGAISTLNGLGVIDNLYFGSECGDINILKESANMLINEPNAVSQQIQMLLKQGLSYPQARELAFKDMIPDNILSAPNNILGLEYIKSLINSNSSIEPKTIKRHIVNHDDCKIDNNFASATTIRKMILQNKDIKNLIPKEAYTIMEETNTKYNISVLDTAITAFLRTTTPDYLKTIYDVTEGLENRIINAAQVCSTFDSIAAKIKTKRYALSRIRRVILSSMLGITKDLSKLSPQYIRILGMNETGKAILSLAKKQSTLPIITKCADFDKSNPLFKKDILSTDIFSLCCNDPNFKIAGLDFIKSPIIF